MTIRTFLACLLTATSIVHATPPNALLIDCKAPVRPTQAQVSQLYGIDNFTAAYAAREKVIRIAHVACMRGAASVNVAVERDGKGNPTADRVALDSTIR